MKNLITVERILLAAILSMQAYIIMDMRAFRMDGNARACRPTEATVASLPEEPPEYTWTRVRPVRENLRPVIRPVAPRSLFYEMDAMMESAFRDMDRMTRLMGRDESWDDMLTSPAMDMREVDDRYVVSLSLPGLDPSDIQIDLDGRLLTVWSTRELGGGHSQHTHKFRRVIQMPGPVGEEANASAYLTNGVLQVSIPKPI